MFQGTVATWLRRSKSAVLTKADTKVPNQNEEKNEKNSQPAMFDLTQSVTNKSINPLNN